MTTTHLINDRNAAVYIDGQHVGHALYYIGRGWTFAAVADDMRDGARYHATARAALAEVGLMP